MPAENDEVAPANAGARPRAGAPRSPGARIEASSVATRRAAIVGLLTALLAFAALSFFLRDVLAGMAPAPRWDNDLLLLASRLRQPSLTSVAIAVTALGSPTVVAPFVLVVAAVAIARADRRGAALLVISSLAAVALTYGIKAAVDRPRPRIVAHLVAASEVSYPSGHALAASAVYLTAAFVGVRHLSGAASRAALVACTGALVLLVGASRIYLGVHYPSDVLGGLLLGTASALVALAVL